MEDASGGNLTTPLGVPASFAGSRSDRHGQAWTGRAGGSYGVVERFRRRGLAAEAARACRDHALHVLGCGLVVSIVRADDVASRIVAGRIHDRVVGTAGRGVSLRVYSTERRAPPRAGGSGEAARPPGVEAGLVAQSSVLDASFSA